MTLNDSGVQWLGEWRRSSRCRQSHVSTVTTLISGKSQCSLVNQQRPRASENITAFVDSLRYSCQAWRTVHLYHVIDRLQLLTKLPTSKSRLLIRMSRLISQQRKIGNECTSPVLFFKFHTFYLSDDAAVSSMRTTRSVIEYRPKHNPTSAITQISSVYCQFCSGQQGSKRAKLHFRDEWPSSKSYCLFPISWRSSPNFTRNKEYKNLTGIM